MINSSSHYWNKLDSFKFLVFDQKGYKIIAQLSNRAIGKYIIY